VARNNTLLKFDLVEQALKLSLQITRAGRRAVAGDADYLKHGRKAHHALDLIRATKWGQASPEGSRSPGAARAA
jgi:hypothetical protein